MESDYGTYAIRSSAILTSSYVAGSVVGVDVGDKIQYQQNQLILLVDFTIGSLTTAEIKVETSPDNTTFYQVSNGIINNGTIPVYLTEYQLSATGKYRIPVQIKDRYVKISVKGTGTATSSLMAITAMIGLA